MKESKNQDHDIYVNILLNGQIGRLNNYQKIARNVWLKKDRIFISKIEKCPGLKIKFRRIGNKLFVDAYFNDDTRKFKDKIASYFKIDQINRELRFISFIYYLIYYPFFYYLERLCDFFLHAAGIENYEIGIIQSGLGGIGKSTFTVSILLSADCKILSDTIIFNDTHNIYSQPGAIALGRDSWLIIIRIGSLKRQRNNE